MKEKKKENKISWVAERQLREASGIQKYTLNKMVLNGLRTKKIFDNLGHKVDAYDFLQFHKMKSSAKQHRLFIIN